MSRKVLKDKGSRPILKACVHNQKRYGDTAVAFGIATEVHQNIGRRVGRSQADVAQWYSLIQING